MQEKKKIEENEKLILKELRQHDGWGEIKIKGGYFVEARKRVPICPRKKE